MSFAGKHKRIKIDFKDDRTTLRRSDRTKIIVVKSALIANVVI